LEKFAGSLMCWNAMGWRSSQCGQESSGPRALAAAKLVYAIIGEEIVRPESVLRAAFGLSGCSNIPANSLQIHFDHGPG
jgi:hypothetical protein